MTYNQKAFIEDAMNGFVMQQTDFPYLCIVMDDCSTDGEQEIIQKYVQEGFIQLSNKGTDNYTLNLCRHKTNENCYFAVFYLKYNHWTIKKPKEPYYEKWLDKCKYIAFCEGDDYWIDKNKLETQVVYLEHHKGYTCSGHGFIVKYQHNNEEKDFTIYDGENEYFTFTINDFCKKWVLKTLTCIYKKEIFITYLDKKYKYGKDTNLQYHALKKGNGIYFIKPMGVYNHNNKGVWAGSTNYARAKWNYYNIKEIYYKNKKDIFIKPFYINMLNEYTKLENNEKIRKQLNKENQKITNTQSKINHLLMILTHPRYIAGWIKRKLFNIN